MKIFIISALFLIQSLLIAAALPVRFGGSDTQPQLPLGRRPGPVSSANSFSSSSSSSSSASDPKSKLSSLASSLTKSLTAPLTPPSQSLPFRCHSYPPATTSLQHLSSYISTLLHSYTDLFFESKSDPDRITFEHCLAGYREDDVSPSVVFGKMGKKQLGKVEKLLKGAQVRGKFPDLVVVVGARDGILAAVLGGGEGKKEGLVRRVTV